MSRKLPRVSASRIATEIAQRRPFRSATHECLVSLLRTTDVLRRSLTRVVEPHGITLQQYNVLRILRGAGDAGLPTLEIAARMIEQAPGITRLLDRLDRKGLVRRERCPQDRRQVLCHLTPAGGRLLARLDASVDRSDREGLATLSPSDLRALLRLLDRVRSGHG